MNDVPATSSEPLPSVKQMKRDANIAEVQKLLLEKGYSDVGLIDGDMTPKGKTEDEILSFRNRNDLPLKTTIDDQFLKALRDAPVKQLPPRQTEATTADIAPKVDAVSKNLWTKFWAKVTAIPAAFMALFLGIINNLGDAIETLSPLKVFLSDWLEHVDKLTLLMIAAGGTTLVSAVIWLTSRGADSALKEGYNKGTVTDDNKHAERLSILS